MNTKRVDYNRVFWLLYCIMIALPLHASNKLLSYLSITGMVSIFHVVFGVMMLYLFAVVIRSQKIHIGGTKLLIYAYGVFLVLALVNGFRRHSGNINSVIGDFVMYFLSFAILCVTNSRLFVPVDLRWFLRKTFDALTVCLTINVLMYLTAGFGFWGVTSFNNGRFGGGYISLIVVTVLYGVYDFLYEKTINNKLFIYHIVFAIISSLLAQSRTHIILCAAGCIILMIPLWKKTSKRVLFRIFIALIVAIIGAALFLRGDSDLVQRLLSMDVTSKNETTASRVITWNFYWRLIKANPSGTGFGEIMYFINPSMTYAIDTATYYVDNAVAVVLYKGGWIFGCLYFAFIIKTVFLNLKYSKENGDRLYLLASLIMIMLVVSTMIMTSQAIHTYAVNVFVWTLIGITNKGFKKEGISL